MAQPGTASRIVLAVIWFLLGCAMVAVPAWLGWTRWPVILNGHPAMLVAGIACAMFGVVAVAWAVASLIVGGRQDREVDSANPRSRTFVELRRRARWRVALAVPALIVCVLLVSLLVYARPFAATPAALAALRSTADVRYADRLTWYELAPIRTTGDGSPIRPTTGLVFYPGARVDSRAYAAALRPLARAGYLVVVLKEPFGLATVQPQQAESPLGVHPEIRYWAVGGHSLGGTAAASFASSAGDVRGLLLWASYPATPVLRTNLKVMSVSGTADALATPVEIQASKANLPPRASFVAVRGAVHSSFGDYGEQPGDGAPGVPRAAAQAQIVKASASLLASLKPTPRRR